MFGGLAGSPYEGQALSRKVGLGKRLSSKDYLLKVSVIKNSTRSTCMRNPIHSYKKRKFFSVSIIRTLCDQVRVILHSTVLPKENGSSSPGPFHAILIDPVTDKIQHKLSENKKLFVSPGFFLCLFLGIRVWVYWG